MNLSKINIFQIITLIISIAFLATIKCQDILSIPNFDIREKFRDCYNEGYSSDYDEILCTTNWPIQFTLLLTDKTCILSGKKNRRLISSMNINSCMPIGDNIQNCRDLSGFYSLEKSTRQIITDTIK